MSAADNCNDASWVSSRLSKRIRSFPKPANQLYVFSTAQRCLPSISLLSDASSPEVGAAMPTSRKTRAALPVTEVEANPHVDVESR